MVSLEPNARTNVYSDRPSQDLIAFVRICSHYFANAAWLEDDELLLNARRLEGIPGVIIHGRLDLSCPIASAWELAQAWRHAQFHDLSHAGHQATSSLRSLLLQAHAELSGTKPGSCAPACRWDRCEPFHTLTETVPAAL